MNAPLSVTPASETLKRYLQHIANDEPLAPTGSFALVQELNRRHIDLFSFSSVGVLLGWQLPLDVPALLEKLVVQRKGGYCFEHNRLFHEVLSLLGYSVRSVLARVLYNQSVDCPEAPKTHRLILLELEGERYVVDVGFGANGPKAPVKLDPEPTRGPHGDEYRVVPNALGDYLLQIKKHGDFFTLYSFDLARYNEADFEMSHFYSHKHPSAGFVNNLVVARIHDGEVRSLKNDSYMKIYPSGEQQQVITSAAQLRELLAGEFGHEISRDESETLFQGYCCAPA